MMELCFLNGRKKLGDYKVHSLVQVPGEAKSTFDRVDRG